MSYHPFKNTSFSTAELCFLLLLHPLFNVYVLDSSRSVMAQDLKTNVPAALVLLMSQDVSRCGTSLQFLSFL